MSELDPNASLELIPLDAIIEIKLSGAFYGRLQEFASQYASTEKDTLVQRMKELETREPEDYFEHNLTTLLLLIKAIEESAAEQKLTVNKSIADIKAAQADAPES